MIRNQLLIFLCYPLAQKNQDHKDVSYFKHTHFRIHSDIIQVTKKGRDGDFILYRYLRPMDYPYLFVSNTSLFVLFLPR